MSTKPRAAVVKVLKEKLQVVSGGVELLVLMFKGSGTWRRRRYY